MIEQISALILDIIINVVYAKIMYIYNRIVIWFNFIMSIVQSIIDLFSGKISFTEFLGQIWNAIVTLINDLIANFISYMSGVWASIMGFIGNFGIELADWFRDLPNTIINALKSGWNALGDWWSDLIS
jgi:phage-related protein